ncbi:hypothetical protein [uncultured Sphaerochaeta sp.]|uniref:hypothetical protein n=1 Tax=uncultured Sphaerochaeta sp. TaxID=886478 RepID=UPI002AA79623|nr:hypothetical protein [uncultured Sphaerochaeta sp.]
MKHKNSYRFTRFTLSKAPGFLVRSFGDLTALHPGLNILTGANGVGKTTIIKAFWSLLFTPAKHPSLEAEAVLQRGETEWFLSLSSNRLEQKRISDGLITTIPGRNDAFADAYWFPLHELLTKEGVGEAFLEAIRKEMQGGVDLERAVREAGGIEAFSRKRHTLVQALKEKQRLVRDQQTRILENLDLRENISKLQETLEESEGHTAERIRLESLLEYLSVKETYEEILSQQKSYHPVLGNMTVHSLSEARTREHEWEAATSAMQQAKAALMATQSLLDQCNVDQAVLDDSLMPRLIEQRSDALQEAKRALDAAKNEAKRAQEARSAWENAHRWLMEDSPNEQTLEKMVKQLNTLAYTSEPIRCQLASSEYIVRAIGEEEPIADGLLERLRDIKQQLTALVVLAARIESQQPTISRVKSSLMGVFSLLSVAIGSILGLLFHPGYSLIAIPLLALLFIIAGRKRANPLLKEAEIQLTNGIGKVNALLEKHGQAPLDSSTAADISRAVGLLSNSIASLQQKDALNVRRRIARKAYEEALSQWKAWLYQWEDVASDLKLSSDPSLEGAQFFHFAEHLQEWVHLQAAEKESFASLGEVENAYREVLLALQNLCGTSTSDVVELLNIASTLVTTITDARSFTKQCQKETQHLENAIIRFHEAEEARNAYNTDLGLDVGDIHTLERLDPQVAEYQGIASRLQLVKTKLEGYSEQIREEAEHGNASDFTVLLEETNTQLERRKEQEKTLWEWERTYRELCNDSNLENAELECLKAEEALEAFRQEEVAQRMVYQLYEQTKEQSERTYQPQVLKKASTWLQRITQNRYLFTVGDAGFLAHDTVTMRPYTLDQLSSGTRIQLLFSLRMAFLEMLEGGGAYQFPLFFDELMANSDDERSLAIAKAIAEIAKERQVFYCTAQQDEVRKLEQVANGDCLLINLEDEQREYRILQHPFQEVPIERASLPPFKEDYLAYAAACKVSRPEPWDSLGNLSSWYLCTTSKELERLLDRGFSKAGQAKGVSEVYSTRFTLLSIAQKMARQGRAKLLTPQDLDDDGLSLNREANYFDALLTFLKERPRSGDDVIAAIEEKTLKGFREPTLSAFTAWLYENGYASEETPYTLSEILERICLEFEELTVSSDDYMLVKRYLQSLGLIA